MRAIFLNLSAHTIVPINYGIAKFLADQIPILQIYGLDIFLQLFVFSNYVFFL